MARHADGSYVYPQAFSEGALAELRQGARALGEEMGEDAFGEMLAKFYEKHRKLVAGDLDNPIHEFMRQYGRKRAGNAAKNEADQLPAGDWMSSRRTGNGELVRPC